MVSPPAINQEADRHKVQKLHSVPDVKVFWPGANEIATDENIHNTENERYLLADADCFGVGPLLAELIDSGAHLLFVADELLISRRYASPPFLDHTLFGILGFGFESLTRAADLASLARETLLQLLELLRKCEIVEKIKNADAVKRRKGVPIILVRRVGGKGRLSGKSSVGGAGRTIVKAGRFSGG